MKNFVKMSAMYEWTDSEPTGAIGWICIDSIINGCSAGILVVTLEACQDNTIFMAKNATLSSAVATPLIGGAAAMIKFDKESPLSVNVIQRFLTFHMSLLSNVLSLVGTNDEETLFIDEKMHQLKLNGSQHSFSTHYSDTTNQPDLANEFGSVTKWLCTKTSLSNLAFSFGVCQIINSLRELLSIAEPRVYIVGIGSVGSSIAYFLENQKIAKIVGICDSDGCLSVNDGLPISRILNLRMLALQKRNLLGQSEEERRHCSNNILCNLDESQLKRFNASSNGQICFDADFLIFCDQRLMGQYFFDAKNASQLLSRSGEHNFVIPAVPQMSKKEILLFEESAKNFQVDKVTLIPHWLCVGGETQLIRSLITIPFKFDNLDRASATNLVLDSIAAPITFFMQETFFDHSKKQVTELAFAFEKCAKQRINNNLLFAVIKYESRQISSNIFVDAAKIQEGIVNLMSEILVLFRALFKSNNDAILLCMLEDLITHFLVPHLQTVYCADDTGERKNKRFFLSLLQGVQSFLKTCALAKSDDASTFLEKVVQQRPKDVLDPLAVTAAVLKSYNLPFSPETLTLALETLILSEKAFIALEYLLESFNTDTNPIAADPSIAIESEKHKSQFGVALGGIISSICEIAQIPFVAQLMIRAFLFFGGGFFLGGKFDQQLEPNIGEDIAILKTISSMLKVCQTTEQDIDIQKRIAIKLEKLLPSIPMAKNAPEQIAISIEKIISDPELIRELIYFYMMPSLLNEK